MAHIPRLVCEPCNQEMRPLKNGVVAESMVYDRPYYKVECDRWECEQCRRTVLSGFADGPFAIHHELAYEQGPAADVRFTFRC